MITRSNIPTLKMALSMKTTQVKSPSLAQWLEENRPLLKQAKKHGYSSKDVVSFLDSQNVPSTTKMIEKATGRGLTKETRKLAKQIELSVKQYQQLTISFTQWSSQSNILSKYEVIEALKDEIDLALKNGYDFDDIADILTVEGHSISGRSLKSYYQQISQTISEIEENTIEPELSQETTEGEGEIKEQRLVETTATMVEMKEPEVIEELLSHIEAPRTVSPKKAKVATSTSREQPSHVQKTASKKIKNSPSPSAQEYKPPSLREFDESQLEELLNL